jgi:bifunctional enzyme CysN/CysC
MSAARGLLRVLTCGSVDDGKSTLIGRLLHETGCVTRDQQERLERDSRRHGTNGDAPDFALLLDGLEAEREQGITIDVAWRYFSTARRAFIVADCPGHEQYTRNMATGASHCDAAVILVDAGRGLSPQTRRHSHICSLMGVRHIVLAVNKIDLLSDPRERFTALEREYRAFAQELGFHSLAVVPTIARDGDNLVTRSRRTPWYTGPTLVELLESLEVDEDLAKLPFRMHVQWVNRSGHSFRGYCGTVASGVVRPGDRLTVAPSGIEATLARIVSADGDLGEARPGDAVTLVLADGVDVARGDVLVQSDARPEVVEQFAAHLLWMDEDALLPGRSYLMRIGTRHVPVRVTTLKHRLEVSSGEHLAARTLALNDIGFCNLSTDTPVALESYDANRAMGAFILIDRFTHATAGAGMIAFALRRATNVHRQPVLIDKTARARLHGHRPALVWFTGLPGSGKSTIANLVERELHARGVRTYLLDGDNLRHGLNRDLGFTTADRVENIRRVGEVARLFVDSGAVVLCAFISPFRAERRALRERLDSGEFVEVFVDAPLEECERRDPKGLYARARAGEITNFTGVDSPYETPENPEVLLHTHTATAEECARRVIVELEKRIFAAGSSG